jgi:hypothetical protein
MDELDQLREFRAGAAFPAEERVAAAREALLRTVSGGRARARRPPRVVVALAAAAAVVLVSGLALAAADVLPGRDILGTTPAPPEKQRALTGLFPPLRIGPATTLAAHGGRTLFGARTARGGYCFSATSPIDPKAEGGHCVSDAEARALDARRTVAFAMSGGSVGGYAPGAHTVTVSGLGREVTLPVRPDGWWVGVFRLPEPPLPPGTRTAMVVATALGADGRVAGRDALLRVESRNLHGATVYTIAFV